MEKEDQSHTFKLQRSQSSLSWLTGRSKSSRLLQDTLSSYNGALLPLPGYERLSQSMRLYSEEPRQEKGVRRLRQGGWVRKVIGHVFFRSKVDGDGDDERNEGEGKKKKKERKKKRSSWLPDPERRWPVQGW